MATFLSQKGWHHKRGFTATYKIKDSIKSLPLKVFKGIPLNGINFMIYNIHKLGLFERFTCHATSIESVRVDKMRRESTVRCGAETGETEPMNA